MCHNVIVIYDRYITGKDKERAMFTYFLYGAALAGLIASFCSDRQKTVKALRKAWRSFENILPSVLAVLLLIGLILSLLDTQTVSRLLGAESGLRGIVIAAIVGCITLIPGFVAMPLAASLVAAGAGYTQVAVFISTLMMVGVATLPMEARYFGRRTAIKRNLLFLAAALVTSLLVGGVMAW